LKDKIRNGSVCFLTYDLGFGGAEKVIVTLANELSLSGRDISIAMLGTQNDFKNILSPNIQIIPLNCENIKYSPLTLLNFFYKNSFENLVANLWPITTLSFLVKLIKPQTNFVIIEHCELSEQFKNKGAFFKKILQLSIKTFYTFSNSIVAVSSGIKHDLIKLGAPPNKIKVIYNPFYQNSQHSNEIYNKKILEWLKTHEINIITVGKLKESKNFLNLIKSIEILKSQYKKKINLLILGDGDERPKIEKYIVDNNLQKSIFLPGWVPNPIPYMELSDLFVLSSDYEGFGVVIIEAFSVGLNVVSTNSSGPAEILKSGELGSLCPINDPPSLAESIIAALKNPLSKEILVKRAAEFKPKKIIQEYEKILN
jgi:glycosyltransferase involved in cell wall biosynthesis